MNLHFGRNAEVDYGLHDEDEGKTRKPFFVTDTGFIRARVQQNYDALTWGQYGCAAADVNKDDLGEADLTNLFSLLNIVVVTDQTGTEPPDEDEEDEEKDNDGEDGGEEDEDVRAAGEDMISHTGGNWAQKGRCGGGGKGRGQQRKLLR